MAWKLPEDYVKRGLSKAHGALFMGVPMKELSREELLAIAALGWQEYQKQLVTIPAGEG